MSTKKVTQYVKGSRIYDIFKSDDGRVHVYSVIRGYEKTSLDHVARGSKFFADVHEMRAHYKNWPSDIFGMVLAA